MQYTKPELQIIIMQAEDIVYTSLEKDENVSGEGEGYPRISSGF